MVNLAAEATKDWLVQNVFVPGHALVLTLLVDRAGVRASINIDGPFRIARFFPGTADEEDVIEPEFAKRRNNNDPETNVHLHVTSWHQLNWCRVWHKGNRVGDDCRICFFATPPDANDRGPELF